MLLNAPCIRHYSVWGAVLQNTLELDSSLKILKTLHLRPRNVSPEIVWAAAVSERSAIFVGDDFISSKHWNSFRLHSDGDDFVFSHLNSTNIMYISECMCWFSSTQCAGIFLESAPNCFSQHLWAYVCVRIRSYLKYVCASNSSSVTKFNTYFFHQR